MGRAHEVRAASMAKTAAMKSSKYAKWGKEIFEAAKHGDPNPEMNQSLKRTIEKAKKDQCPANVIKRALEKAEGIKSGSMSETVYEGYGNGNVAVIVEAATDNVNRTFSSIRSIFGKTGGSLGSQGCVSYMFSRKAIVSFEGDSTDDVEELLIMSDCDYESVEVKDGVVTITAEAELLDQIKTALEDNDPEIDFIECESKLISSMYVELDDDKKEKFQRMLDLLAEDDDVQNVYHNASNVDDVTSED